MDYDPYDLLVTPEEQAQAKAKALQDALRQDRAVSILGALSGSPTVTRLGQALNQGSEEKQQMLAQLPRLRQAMAMQAQQLSAARQKQADIQSPASGRLFSQALAQFGFQAPEGTPPSVMEAFAPTAEKAAAHREGMVLKRALAGAGGATLDPAALDQAAEMYARTGQMPQLGLGKQAAVIKAAVANRAAAMHPEADLAGAKAGYHADTASLGHLQQQADQVEAFEATANANLDRAISQMKGQVDVGSPLLNAPLRKLAGMVGGSPKAAAAHAALVTAMNEVSKVLSGGTGAGAVSDSARNEAESLIGPGATMAQVEAAADILRKDMATRREMYRSQLGEIRGRAGSGKAPATARAASGANPQLEAARDWLAANPNDPSAPAVRAKIQKLGGP